LREAGVPEPLSLLRQVASAPEAEIVAARLREVGIISIVQRSIGGPEWASSGAQALYVRPTDLTRAREILAADEQPIGDEELARLSEEAGRARRAGEE
jgi:hypothetical protein